MTKSNPTPREGAGYSGQRWGPTPDTVTTGEFPAVPPAPNIDGWSTVTNSSTGKAPPASRRHRQSKLKVQKAPKQRSYTGRRSWWTSFRRLLWRCVGQYLYAVWKWLTKTKNLQPTGLVPSTGVRGLFWRFIGWRLFRRYGWQWTIKRSVSERIKTSWKILWELRKVKKTIAVANSKGGAGKTPVSVWLSVFYAWVIKRPVIAFDANENSGHTHDQLGVLRTEDPHEEGQITTIQLREYLRRCEAGMYPSLKALEDDVDWDPEQGVVVIASDPASDETFTREQFELGLQVAQNAAHAVFCDLGNGIPHAANVGSVNLAHGLIFPGNTNTRSRVSLDDISNTKNLYSQMGYPQKVQRGIIVILGAKRREQAKFAKEFNVPADRLFIIPKNRYMMSCKPARVGRVPRRIHAIMLEILVALMTADVIESEMHIMPKFESKESVPVTNVGQPEAERVYDVPLFTVPQSINGAPGAPVPSEWR